MQADLLRRALAPGLPKGMVGLRPSSWLARCANPNCSTSSFRKRLLAQFSGVFIAEEWYCCPDCFESAAQKKLSQILAAEKKNGSRQVLRMPLGLMLLQRQILTAEQLTKALRHQQASGANIGEVVQQLGYATEQQVTSAVAAQWGCPVFTPRDKAVMGGIKIPRILMERHRFLPVHFVEAGSKLLVGFVEAVHNQILSTLESMTACTAVPCFITPTAFRQGLSTRIASNDREVIFEHDCSAANVARVARNYLIQLNARRARFGLCRDILWARVQGGRQEMDLLFQAKME